MYLHTPDAACYFDNGVNTQRIAGVLVEDSIRIKFILAEIGSGFAESELWPPAGGDQEATVVVSGDSSGVELEAVRIVAGGAGMLSSTNSIRGHETTLVHARSRGRY